METRPQALSTTRHEPMNLPVLLNLSEPTNNVTSSQCDATEPVVSAQACGLALSFTFFKRHRDTNTERLSKQLSNKQVLPVACTQSCSIEYRLICATEEFRFASLTPVLQLL